MTETTEKAAINPEHQHMPGTIMDVGGIAGGIFAALVIVLGVLIKLRKSGIIDNAEAGLYSKLNEQVQGQKAELDKVYAERNKLHDELSGIRHRVDRLETCESSMQQLKSKLEEKDALLMERDRLLAGRDARIEALMVELLQMKDRVHHLELRLAADERRFCKDCDRVGTVHGAAPV